jgi:RNA polymerase sigma factor (sigma-70 family)
VPTDYELEVDELQAIVRRDQEAFKRWLKKWEIPLKLSLRSFAELVDVEAVVQDTAIKVWQEAPRITPDGRPTFLLRWARTVALNSARNILRRTEHRADHREQLPSDDELLEVASSQAPDPFLQERVRQCLERLQSNQQRAFRARIDDDGAHKDRELAAAIGMGFDAFRQNLARGRKALVGCLASFGIDVKEYLR